MSEPVQPPDYLSEKIDDLIQSRFVVLTNRRWMEAYHELEDGEAGTRLMARRAHGPALRLWSKQLTLYKAAFTRGYDWEGEHPREVSQAVAFRLDLLGLAGGNFKLALDALLAGYYSACLNIGRHLLETWRRVAYARLSPEDIWRWYPRDMWPDDVQRAPVGEMPTKPPDAKQIARVIDERGSDGDKHSLEKVRAGFDILSDHTHPTLEGATQTWTDEPGRRAFGPTFSDPHCRRGLTWGLAAGGWLLAEIAEIDPQGNDWLADLTTVGEELSDWLKHNQG